MRVFVLILIHLFFVFGIAQNQAELLNTLKKASPQAQAVMYNQLADMHKSDHAKQMYDYANKALALAQQYHQPIEQAKANYYLGIFYVEKSNYPQAKQAFESTKSLIKNDYKNNIELESLYAKSTANLGLILMEQNQYFQALTNYQSTKSIFEKQNQKAFVSHINNNIGVIYRSVGDYQNALKCFQEVVDFQEPSPSAALGYAYANLGRTFQAMKLFDKAITNYQKAVEVFQKYPDNRGLGELYNYWAETTLSLKDYQSTENHLNIAEQQFKTSDYSFGLSDTYYIYGKLYFEQNQMGKALDYAKKTLAISEELKAIESQANAHQLLSKIYESNNQTALAYAHLKKYNQFKSELTDIKTIRANFETEKQQALAQQQADHQLSNEKGFRNKLIWIFGLILLAGGILSYFIVQNHKKAKQTAELQKELADYEQKALHLQMNPHFVFNCLAAISAFIVQNSQQDAIKYLSKFSKLMRLTLDYSKTSLITIDKEIEGLTNYLELEKLRFQNIFDYTITKDAELEDDCALPPMLLQPLVENAIIHGIVPNKNKKGQIDINFSLFNDYLMITIQDNGIGLNESKLLKANSLGTHESMALDIVSKRLEKMHHQATFEIVDLCENNQNGTKVSIKLPLLYVDLSHSTTLKKSINAT